MDKLQYMYMYIHLHVYISESHSAGVCSTKQPLLVSLTLFFLQSLYVPSNSECIIRSVSYLLCTGSHRAMTVPNWKVKNKLTVIHVYMYMYCMYISIAVPDYMYMYMNIIVKFQVHVHVYTSITLYYLLGREV